MNDLYRRIDSLLEERARDYPRRVEPLFSTLQAAILELAAALREAAGEVEPLRARLAATPVVVCGYYRSGTTLMHGLLQSHPDVLALPSEARWFGRRFTSVDELHDGWIRRAVSPDGIPPFWSLGRPWEGGDDRYLLFTRRLLAYAAGRDAGDDLLGIVAAAFADAHGITPRVWVEKTPRDEVLVDEILGAYPNARFIQLVRDPRATVASIRGWNRGGQYLASTPEAAVELRTSLELAQERDNYLVVRYEDLVESPEREMRRVAEMLELPWSDALVTPTTTANSSVSERRVQGSIHKLSSDTQLPRVADAVVRAFDAEPARALGYDVPPGSAAVALATRAYLSATMRGRALARGLRPSRST